MPGTHPIVACERVGFRQPLPRTMEGQNDTWKVRKGTLFGSRSLWQYCAIAPAVKNTSTSYYLSYLLTA